MGTCLTTDSHPTPPWLFRCVQLSLALPSEADPQQASVDDVLVTLEDGEETDFPVEAGNHERKEACGIARSVN